MPYDLCISWDELHRDCRELARRLLTQGRSYRGIVAIARGGLIPAGLLAREMGLLLVDTLCISSYDHQQQGEASILKGMPGEDGEGWLLVDDLVDTGKTARIARTLLPKAEFAVIHAKPQGKPLADWFAREMPQEAWIHYPWDSALAYTAPLIEKPD